MAINFNTLPGEKPNAVTPQGTYIGTIKEAEMRQKEGRPPYLNLAIDLTDRLGKPMGRLYDILSESDKDLVRYKLKRFVEAIGLGPILAQQSKFELKDLAKMVVNKKLILDTKVEAGTNGYPDKAVVDVFAGEIYYHMDQLGSLEVTQTEPKPEAVTPYVGEDIPLPPINAADAEDAKNNIDKY